MDERVAPFAVPGATNEGEEAIAVLGWVVDGLLDEHFRAVGALRQRVMGYSALLFACALVATLVFLLQDFERAPVVQLGALGLLPLLFLAGGVLLRTRLIESTRFVPPQVVGGRKLTWTWVTIPVSEERLLLWDTLTDETERVPLPASPPTRKAWLLQEHFPRFESPTEEKRLIRGMATQLEAWQHPLGTCHVPVVAPNPEAILDYLLALPPHAPEAPVAPPLPMPRSVESGVASLESMLRLYQNERIFMRRLAAWEEALPGGQRGVVSALAQTQPPLEPPPPLPEGHPMGSVESLLGALDVVRSRALKPLEARVADERERLESERDQQLRVLEQDWQRERNAAAVQNEALLQSLRRQIRAIEERTLPDAEKMLGDSEARLTSERKRVSYDERSRLELRKELAALGPPPSDGPHPSDAQRAHLRREIARLESVIPEAKHNMAFVAHTVSLHRGAVERIRLQLQGLIDELDAYATQREAHLQEIDNRFATQKGVLNARYIPDVEALEADATFLGAVHGQLSDVLKPHRTDLAMASVKERAYTRVVQEAGTVLSGKQLAVERWSQTLAEQIEHWRRTAQTLVATINARSLEAAGGKLQRFVLPVWVVETAVTPPTLWPWQRMEPQLALHIVAPMVSDSRGQRVALPGTGRPMRPMPLLQARLSRLMEGERGATLRDEMRRSGRPVSFSARHLEAVASATEMPRLLEEALRPAQQPALERGEEVRSPLFEAGTEGDAFVDLGPAVSEDAWAEISAVAPNDEDAWQDEGPADPALDGRDPSTEVST